MTKPLEAQLKKMGVVGAGGAGFPAGVKAAANAEFVIANGAECEPLIHKDAELMQHFPGEVVAGMTLMMESTGARSGKFGIKAKNAAALDAIKQHLRKVEPVQIAPVILGDFYPSGDEYELVYSATGRLIPPGGIPLQVGCVVNNVETLYNVHYAKQGIPVTSKFLSICGAVRKPCTVRVPVGTSFRDLLPLAGGATVADFAIFISGLMMGTLTFDLDDVVTKTTGALVVLPRDHYLVMRKERPLEAMARIGKSACDQCSYCTEFCPRYLLGYEVMPHKVMRSLGFSATGNDVWNQWAQLCCACGLCTLYACPEDLYPKEACDQSKIGLKTSGIKFVQEKPVRVHPMKDGRRVPLAMLRKRLKVEEYEKECPFMETNVEPKTARMKLNRQSPVVRAGQQVKRGDPVATVDEGALGADLHAGIAGRVAAVTAAYVEIEHVR